MVFCCCTSRMCLFLKRGSCLKKLYADWDNFEAVIFSAQIGERINSRFSRAMWFSFFFSKVTALGYHSSVISVGSAWLWPYFPPPTREFLFAICLSEYSGSFHWNWNMVYREKYYETLSNAFYFCVVRHNVLLVIKEWIHDLKIYVNILSNPSI